MSDQEKEQGNGEQKKGVAIGVTIFALALIAAVVVYNALTSGSFDAANLQEETQTSMEEEAEDATVPYFVMTNSEGTAVSIRDFEGKPIVLNFWASTCGPCQSEMPHFQAAYEDHGDEVNFIMVDIPGFNGETVERAESFLEANGYTFPAFFDTEGDASVTFGLTSIPRTYFIDADGQMVAMGTGALSASALQQGLDMLSVS